MDHQDTMPIFSLLQNKKTEFDFKNSLIILFPLAGSVKIKIPLKEYHLNPPSILVLQPLELFQIDCPCNANLLIIEIPHKMLKYAKYPALEGVLHYINTSQTAAAHQEISRLCAEVFQEFFQKKRFAHAHITVKILLLLEILKQGFRTAAAPGKPYITNQLKNVLNEIHKNWGSNLTLSSLAEKEFLSANTLSRLFQEKLHVNFVEYLVHVRLFHACEELRSTKKSVTQIALDHGFGSVHSFIRQFRLHFHTTPGQYRIQKAQRKVAAQEPKNIKAIPVDCGLADFLQYTQNISEQVPVETIDRSIPIYVKTTAIALKHTWKTMINVGFARDILLAPIQKALKKLQHEIGFSYARFAGIFDEDMQIYQVGKDGAPVVHMAYLDMVIDFLLSLQFKPSIELGGIPSLLAQESYKIYHRSTIVSKCTDLNEWKRLIQFVLQHWIRRYGLKEVLSWKFTALNMNYVFMGCMDHQAYHALYCASFEAVKGVDKRLSFGGPGIFANLLEEEEGMPAFLSFAQANGCLPDFFTLECYPYHNILHDKEFLDFSFSQQSAPTVLSSNPNFLSDAIHDFSALLQEHHLESKPIYLEEWNSTLWQRDLSGDTCYKAAFLIKNICENYDQIACFGYWSLSDLLKERPLPAQEFHGGYGLFTCSGIPKSGYQALRLLTHIGHQKLGSGSGWFASASEAGHEIQIIAYNYCHYADLYRYRYQQLDVPQDAYTVFQEGCVHKDTFYLTGLDAGVYQIERYRIDRENGSSFDRWIEMGAPPHLEADEREYLEETSNPSYQIENCVCNGTLEIHVTLANHEVELICLRSMDTEEGENL